MIVYNKFFELLKTKNINVSQLRRDNVVTQSALTAMRRNADINTRSVERICNALGCQPGDIMEYVPDADIMTHNGI